MSHWHLVRVGPATEMLYDVRQGETAMMSTSMAARQVLLVVAIVVIGAMTSGCEAIGTIFKAGVWVGAIAVIAVVALVAFVAMKVRRS